MGLFSNIMSIDTILPLGGTDAGPSGRDGRDSLAASPMLPGFPCRYRNHAALYRVNCIERIQRPRRPL